MLDIPAEPLMVVDVGETGGAGSGGGAWPNTVCEVDGSIGSGDEGRAGGPPSPPRMTSSA
jgi:hypothetical protein